MTEEKIDVSRCIEDILQLDIGYINKELIYSKFKFDEDNFLDFLDKVSYHFSPFGENFYSDDSDWIGFFKFKVVEWFGEDHAFVKIDDDLWLLGNALTKDGVRFWDISRIDTKDIERAKKLVKLMSITEDIGDDVHEMVIENECER